VRWFLREWMETAGLGGRGAQTRMMELTGWSKATMSQLYNGTQGYSPDIIETASVALNVEPHELLMHPERAMAMRQFRESAATIVGTTPPANTPPAAAFGEARRNGTHG